ncbi:MULTISPECIES: TrbI/VirB10 family protein [Sphingopyxis]|jgi:type IV secretion system protein VirB10|uniref:Conjugal transfer protein TraI n=1 Tax=Sphingopyxis granuli TaxID=267128 RepID=A0AA86L435_9SPHN|nr:MULTISPECIES: TrbI/VirB10 family protein [Sphingopyxis]AMG75516.1 Conjugal transfer protein TraI [Sphingopyxis granuli]HEV7312483.1 TrbI/VirB10 family protein [Sphingopyxis sp.]
MSAPERGGEPGVSGEEGAPVVAPASPDGFRLEGEMPRVMRLSRRTLAIAGGAAGLAIGGALLWALRTPDPKTAQELYEVTNPNKSEAVTSAPADYGAVPKLGPPLPGDLGRPIVSAQNAGETVPVPGMAQPPVDPRVAAAEQARQRAAQERDAATASRLFLGSGGASLREAATEISLAPTPAAAADDKPTTTSARRRFLVGDARGAIESDEKIVAPSSPFILQAGAVIPAALITGIRSDLPGQISAQVTQNVFDSPTGRLLLIPQGARLVGEYDSEVVAGQRRVLLAWDRLILPGGRSIRLDRQPGADASGMAGVEDRVDNHWGRMLRAALISSLLGVGTELVSNNDSDLVRALRGGVQDSSNEAGRRVVERELSVPPTLTVRPGLAFRVIVTRDLIFEETPGARP